MGEVAEGKPESGGSGIDVRYQTLEKAISSVGRMTG